MEFKGSKTLASHFLDSTMRGAEIQTCMHGCPNGSFKKKKKMTPCMISWYSDDGVVK